jgi:cytochrome c-type biogenesis protein CcsB
MLRRRLILLAFSCALLAGCAAEPVPDAERSRAVLHNGRVKPLEAYARQTVKLLSGRESWGGRPAIALVLEAERDRSKVDGWKWIRVDLPELKSRLGLAADAERFSLAELRPKTEDVRSLVLAAKEKRDRDERPAKLEQKAELLWAQILSADELASGAQPSKPERVDAPWRLGLEVAYLRSRPFEAAAAAYLLAFALLVVAGRSRGSKTARAGAAVAGVGLAAHTAGLVLRVLVLGRPPVSNMYESMVFMNWALMVFALVFSVLRRNRAALASGALVSALVTIYANLLPIDASLDVLVPVLRSNYWLSVHVMTVVSSYGAFGLAMALGHRQLWLRAFAKDFDPRQEAESADAIYKVIQLGTILIGTGTVLGGVWANESWGRFWGWDPKETWALITFLGYLIVIHLKFARRIGPFGVALAAVLGFELVLMTWYGVNFVLGRGLHSYGAGSGGMNWVLYFLAFEAAFLAAVLSRAKR